MTAIAVAIEHVAFGVDGDFVKVEQVAVATLAAATLLPNAGMVLNGIVGGGIDRDPGPALVVGRGDIDVPDSLKSPVLVGATGSRTISQISAEEAARGPSRAAAHRF